MRLLAPIGHEGQTCHKQDWNLVEEDNKFSSQARDLDPIDLVSHLCYVVFMDCQECKGTSTSIKNQDVSWSCMRQVFPSEFLF